MFVVNRGSKIESIKRILKEEYWVDVWCGNLDFSENWIFFFFNFMKL